MIKVLYDHQVFDMQKYGGISRYFSELFNNFQPPLNVEPLLPFHYTENELLKSSLSFRSANFKNWKFSSARKQSLLRKVLKLYDFVDPSSNINCVTKALKENSFDIFHPTYYNTYFLKYLKEKPFVLTVHDMIHEIYPEYFAADNKTISNKKKLVLKADKIVAVSDCTKRDLLRFYDIPADKIQVIYHGDSMSPVPIQSVVNLSLPSKYILYVGSRAIYKNFNAFIRSIAPILQDDRELYVVCAGGYQGGNQFSADENKLLDQLNIFGRVKIFAADDQLLKVLYKRAICFVFPSLYEGFGIPVLEAFACDCPAIISNTSSLPEVGGTAVAYIDPTNITNMTETIREVVSNKLIRERMAAEGRTQLSKFSWAKAAEETSILYKKIMDA